MKTKRFYELFNYNVTKPYMKRIWINISFFAIDSNDVLEKYILYKYIVTIGFFEINKYYDLKSKLSNKTIYLKSFYGINDKRPVIFLGKKYNNAMSINQFNEILKKDIYLYNKYIKKEFKILGIS